jgi:hypothetical protein
VLAHEFSHGVVQYSAAFAYHGQPGALNESIADVFAAMSVQHAAGQTAEQATWLIGEGLFKPGTRAKGLRSMLEPGTAYDDPKLGKDPQVGSMADYVDTDEDNGGAHLNSGIPNRAFALAATAIGGRRWERAGRVWYDTLTSDQVDASSDFVEFAEATVAAATPPVRRLRRTRAGAGGLGGGRCAAGFGPGRHGRPGAGPRGSGVAERRRARPAGTEHAPQKVSVRRSGGFAGQVRSAEIDLAADPQAEEVQRLLRGVDLRQVTASAGVPDRFVYTVEVGGDSVTVGERDLTPDLQRVVQIVLGTGGSGGGPTDLPATPGGLG